MSGPGHVSLQEVDSECNCRYSRHMDVAIEHPKHLENRRLKAERFAGALHAAAVMGGHDLVELADGIKSGAVSLREIADVLGETVPSDDCRDQIVATLRVFAKHSPGGAALPEMSKAHDRAVRVLRAIPSLAGDVAARLLEDASERTWARIEHSAGVNATSRYTRALVVEAVRARGAQ